MTRPTDAGAADGGRAGLAAGHHPRRQGHDFVVPDAGPARGGARRHARDLLDLFPGADTGTRRVRAAVSAVAQVT